MTALRYNSAAAGVQGISAADFTMDFVPVPAVEIRWRTVNLPHPLSLTPGVELSNGQAQVLQSEPVPGDLFMPTRVARSTRCMQTQGPIL